LRKSLGSKTSALFGLFGSVQIIDSSIDAAWFSRRPQTGEIAWEIRHLSETPFALIEYADESAGDFEEKLREVANRLTKTVRKKRKT